MHHITQILARIFFSDERKVSVDEQASYIKSDSYFYRAENQDYLWSLYEWEGDNNR